MDEFITKTGDTTPITSYLKDADGYVSLSGASVVFIMTEPDGTVKISRGACTILDEDTGYVKYPFVVGDVDTAGSYRGEFEVTFADTVITSFPNDEYIPIKILDDLG